MGVPIDPFGPPPIPGLRPGEFVDPDEAQRRRSSIFTDPATVSAAPPTEDQARSIFTPPAEARRLQAGVPTDGPTPEDAARILRAARSSGLPLDFIAQHLDQVEHELGRRGVDGTRVLRDSPALARFMTSDAYRAALLQDDVFEMTALEQSLAFAANVGRSLAVGPYRFGQGAYGAASVLSEFVGAPRGVTETFSGLEAGARQHVEWIRGPQTGFGRTMRAVFGGIESLSLSGVAALPVVLGGGPVAGAAIFGGTTAGEGMREARRAGLPVTESIIYGLSQGTVELATELPAWRIMGELLQGAGLVRTTLRALGRELPGEQAATLLQDLNTWAAIEQHQGKTLDDYLAERPGRAYETLVATVVASVGQGAIVRAVDRVVNGPAAPRALDAIDRAARQTKTGRRAPDQLASFVDQATRGTAAEAVYLPVDPVTAYFQEQGEDPRTVAARLTGDPDALAKATATGEDLRVPMATYVRELAGTPHHAALRDVARIGDPRARTAAEDAALEREVAATVAAAVEAEGAAPGPSVVGTAARAQFEAAAFPPAQARDLAAMTEAVFGSVAGQAGLETGALFTRFGVRVTRQGLDSEPTAGQAPELSQPRALVARVRRLAAAQADDPDAEVVVYDQTGTRRVVEPSAAETLAVADGETLAVEGVDGVTPIVDRGGRLPGTVRGEGPRILFSEDPPASPGERPVRRGFVLFTPEGTEIRLLPAANLSTVLHELGHLYFAVLTDTARHLRGRDASALTEGQRQLLEDERTIRAWLGAAADATGFTRAQQEQFARGFEAYLFEGRAPTPALAGALERFSGWLKAVYNSLRELRVELSPEVRGVFDRLLAADAATREADAEAGVTALSEALAADLPLTEEEAAAHRAIVATAKEAAETQVRTRLLAELRETQDAGRQAEREDVRAIEARRLAEDPVYRALAALQHGQTPEGQSLPADARVKIDRAQLIRQYGPGLVSELPRPRVDAEDGLAPAVVAELFGFPDATTMLRAFVRAVPFAEAVDAATDAEMARRHGDALTDGSLGAVATGAVLDAGAEIFAAEARLLETVVRRQGGFAPTPTAPIGTLRQVAERRIRETPVGTIRPATFSAAARRAGQRSLEAAGRQDFTAALAAKQQQLLNAELHRAALAAVEEVDRARSRFRRVWADDAKLGKAYNVDLLQVARALLVQFSFATPPAGLDRPWTYLRQVEQYDTHGQLFADLEAAIDAAGADARPYRELTLDEFRAVVDAVDNAVHVARRSRQLALEGKLVELDAARGELQDRLDRIQGPTARAGYDRALTSWEKTKKGLFGWRALLRRVEHWVDAIDGGDPSGSFRRILFTPVSEAAARYREAKRQILEEYLQIAKGLEGRVTRDAIPAPEIGYTFTRMELLHALLHTGNRSNLSKLLRGREWGVERDDGTLDTTHWDRFIARLWAEGVITKADMDYVQATWDLLESVKADAQRTHRDLYGHFFAEVTAEPVVTPVGTYRGGYMPAIVDPQISDDAALKADRATVEGTATSFAFPSTGRGFTQKRIEAYARPLELDLAVIPKHLDAVLRFIHLQPVVKDVGRLLINKAFRARLNRFDPAVAGELLMPWIQRTATQQVHQPQGTGDGARLFGRWMVALRTRTGLNIMAGNVSNALQQVTGLSLAAVKLPPAALNRALLRYTQRPRRLAAAIAEKSVYMRTRTTTQVFEIQRNVEVLLVDPSRYDRARTFAQRHGYILQQGTQNVVDLIVWSAGYDVAVAEGATEAEAVRRADAAVRQTQGSFDPEDMSAFETGKPFTRAFTMFYSYFNMQANLLGTEWAIALRDQGLVARVPRLTYVTLVGLIIPAIVSELIVRAASGDLFDDEDDDGIIDNVLAAAFWGVQRNATAFVPLAGPLVNLGINQFNDVWFDDRISTSPAVSALESAGRTPKAVVDIVSTREITRRQVRDILTFVGLITGLPTGAVARPLGYLADVARGEEEPENEADLVRGLIVGR